MKTIVQLTCAKCNKIFSRSKAQYEVCLKRGHKAFYCSHTCHRQIVHDSRKNANLTCNNCGKPLQRWQCTYCSRSCAAIVNNRIYPKNKLGRKLKPKKVRKTVYNQAITKGELFSKCSNWQSARSIIQQLARGGYDNSEKPKECLVCKYTKHYEICHVKSVSAFDNTALISEINNIDNLIALCPTHHWEFDNGVLDASLGISPNVSAL